MNHAEPAQASGGLAIDGPYAQIRHPQYAGFALIMFGFLLQWPTLITLVLLPILLLAYAKLAKREETEMVAQFGAAYLSYRERAPAFVPRSFSRQAKAADGGPPSPRSLL